MNTNDVNIFAQIRNRFRNYGWTRGAYTAPDGAVCLTQCVDDCGGTSKDKNLLVKAANDLYARPFSQGGKWNDIPAFNDENGRTVAQIHAVVNRAEELREAGIG